MKPLLILRIIHLALTAGAALGTAVFYFLRTQGINPETGTQDAVGPEFGFLGAGAVLAGVLASIVMPRIISKSALEAFRQSDDIIDHPEVTFRIYQNMKIIQWAMIEGAAMLAAVMYFLSGNGIAILAAALAVAYLGWQRSSLEDLKRRLGLSDTQLQSLGEE